MRLYTQDHRCSLILECGNWYFSLFFKPSYWAFGYHAHAECCKFWLMLGVFEINRVYTRAEADVLWGDDFQMRFHPELAALYRYRTAVVDAICDHRNSTYFPTITIVPGEDYPRFEPPYTVPDNLRAALADIDDQILRMTEFLTAKRLLG